MTLKKLWKLTLDAGSTTAGFQETYDFMGEIPPEVIRKLLLERQDLLVAISKALVKLHPKHDARIILLVAQERSKELWPD